MPNWIWTLVGFAGNLGLYLVMLRDKRKEQIAKAEEEATHNERHRLMWNDFKERKRINGFHERS
jgi:hypothetical protein